MKRLTALLSIVLIITGCNVNQRQQAIDQFTPSMTNHYHFVIFYEKDRPDEEYRSSINGMKVLLARKNIDTKVSYQNIIDEKNYHELLGVNHLQVLVFDYKGILYNARNIEVLEGMILEAATR